MKINQNYLTTALTEAFNAPLETERLIIRPIVPDDALQVAAFLNDDDMAYPRESGWPCDIRYDWYDEENARQYTIPSLNDSYTEDDAAFFGIFRRDSGRIVGRLTFESDARQQARLGYFILPSERRQGFAMEAYLAARQQLEQKTLLRVHTAEVEFHNKISMDFLEKAGFLPVGISLCLMRTHPDLTIMRFQRHGPPLPSCALPPGLRMP